MLRLIGFLVMFTATAGGYMFFDYRMSARWSGREDAEGLTVTEYLSGLSGRLAGLSGPASAAGLPTRLADMLPKAPDGWAVRPTEAADVDGFLPKNAKKADGKAVAAIKQMADGKGGSGTEVVSLTYEKGDRKIVVKAIRYPNIIFTSFAAMQQRMELQMQAAQFRGTEFATVRGLDVSEDLLPDGFRGRYFFADVGAQIQLRILAPKRMADEDLVPLLQTLHVKAMNADVIDKVAGLGDVPVIVLASALDAASREAYVADLAARGAEAAAQEAAQRDTPDAEAIPEPTGGGFLGALFGRGASDDPATGAEAASGPKTACKTGKDGVKRCTVESATPGE